MMAIKGGGVILCVDDHGENADAAGLRARRCVGQQRPAQPTPLKPPVNRQPAYARRRNIRIAGKMPDFSGSISTMGICAALSVYS